jgi:hypothetical protein
MQERPRLLPLNPNPYDIARTFTSVASSQFRIEQTLPRPAAPRREVEARQPGRDRPWVKPEEPASLSDRQALAMMAIVDFTERLVIDHDPCPAVRLGQGQP